VKRVSSKEGNRRQGEENEPRELLKGDLSVGSHHLRDGAISLCGKTVRRERETDDVRSGLLEALPLRLPLRLPPLLQRQPSELDRLRRASSGGSGRIFLLRIGVPELSEDRDEAGVDEGGGLFNGIESARNVTGCRGGYVQGTRRNR
jgi:hypothetical protein